MSTNPNAPRDPSAKLAHIEACLSDASQYKKSAGFERYELVNQAGCGIALPDVDLTTTFIGHTLRAPLMIAPMTGGTKLGGELNAMWARAAEHFGIAFSVGSQRVGLENADAASSYWVRQHAPKTLVFGNIGAGQLCKGWGAEEAKRAVDMIEANALFIHLNAMQEACQGGDVDFKELPRKISEVVTALQSLGVPVFAREVGFGMSAEAAQRLVDMGVQGIDVGGAGGTSWAKVEAMCAKSERRKILGEQFAEWGIPTAESIRLVRSVAPQLPLIATGGIRNGQDAVKAIALGADVAAMARPMLLAAHQGEEQLHAFIDGVIEEMRVALFAAGSLVLRGVKLFEVSNRNANTFFSLNS